jgi:hypothetical protein
VPPLETKTKLPFEVRKNLLVERVDCRQASKPIEAFDALIAATALVAGAAVAMRDVPTKLLGILRLRKPCGNPASSLAEQERTRPWQRPGQLLIRSDNFETERISLQYQGSGCCFCAFGMRCPPTQPSKTIHPLL